MTIFNCSFRTMRTASSSNPNILENPNLTSKFQRFIGTHRPRSTFDMVRTKADGAVIRATGAKAPRKNFAAPAAAANIGGGEKTKGREHSGGNSYCPRETPNWQKPITSFFVRPPESGESSKSEKPNKNMDLDAAASTSAASTSKEETDG